MADTTKPPSRKPRVFSTDDPALDVPASTGPAPSVTEGATSSAMPPAPQRRRSWLGWGGLLISALIGLFVLASGLWFTRFVSVALERQDAIGWIATGLFALAGMAALVLIGREVIGLLRLARLGDVRKAVDSALRDGKPASERAAVQRIKGLFATRDDLKWPLARFAEHQGDVHDAGALLRLAERELIVPLDEEARRRVAASAKRVSVVTALSPAAVLTVLFVLFENVRLLRALAATYGARPGTLGGLQLARMVVGHILATSGVAMTDDLFGQFLGQDALRRLSRRLGEGAFNGALTARVGVAAIHVCRPIPFLEVQPVRLRDLLPELFRRSPSATAPEASRQT